MVLAAERIGCLCALHLDIYLNAYENEISWIYSCVFVTSVRSLCCRAPCVPRTCTAVDIQPGRHVCCMLRTESRLSATIVPVHRTHFYHSIFFPLCMRLIYSFIFTSFFLFLLSVVSSFLLPLYKSPSVHSSLPDSFFLLSCISQFCFLCSVSSSLLVLFLSYFISVLSLYLVSLLFLLTSFLSFILFCPCNLFVSLSVLLRLFFLLIFATFSSFMFH